MAYPGHPEQSWLMPPGIRNSFKSIQFLTRELIGSRLGVEKIKLSGGGGGEAGGRGGGGEKVRHVCILLGIFKGKSH